ncbi:hypothetical protein PG999_010450 [Apiospora kogelbergensis]|uniref:Uncharacterized protein n=1 Tax=Apiospora kogelbergensis TaxID=1337665 RepID=A0AAW0QEF0_9PEZI
MHATTVFMAILGFTSTFLAAPITAPTEEVAIEKRFTGGWCGVHVYIKGTSLAYVKVFDGHQDMVTHRQYQARRDGPIKASIFGSGLPQALNFSIATSIDSPRWDSGRAGSKNDRCSVGKWDGEDWAEFSTLNLDCGFTC